jgi:proteasome lid subunit RPN8/RPN11
MIEPIIQPLSPQSFFQKKGIRQNMWNEEYLKFGFGFVECDPRQPESQNNERVADDRPAQWGQSNDGFNPLVRPVFEPLDHDFSPLWAMRITQSAYGEVLDYFRSRKPEAAGILLGPTQDDILITHFVPDEDGDGTPGSFHLNARALNRILERVKPAGINCKGFVHSHPSGFAHPSAGDLAYLERLFKNPANADTLQCFMPIYCDRRVHPFVYANAQLWLAEIILV